MGDLGVIEHDGIVAAVSPSQEADVRAALQAPEETQVVEPEVRAPVTPLADPDASADTTDVEPKRKPRHDMAARMLEATRKESEAKKQAKEAADARAAIEKERDEWRARFEAVSRPAPPVSQAQSPRPPEPPSAKFTFPTLDQWADAHPDVPPDQLWDAWSDDKLAAHYRFQREQDRETEKSARETREQAELHATYQVRVAQAVKTTYPDLPAQIVSVDAALHAAGIQSIPPVLERAIKASERAPDVLYHLATHPEVAIQWARDAAALPIAAVGLVQRSLEALVGPAAAAQTGSAPPPRQSRSAPPPNPVGSTPIATSVSPDVLDPDLEIAKYRQSQQAKRRRS